jgi:hypothetical protein
VLAARSNWVYNEFKWFRSAKARSQKWLIISEGYMQDDNKQRYIEWLENSNTIIE